MPCEYYKDALIDAAASGVTPCEKLRAHLAECLPCREAFMKEQFLFAAIDTGLHAAVNTEVPLSLLPRVRDRINEAGARRFRWLPPVVLAYASAAIVVAIFVMAQLRHTTREDVTGQSSPTSVSIPPVSKSNAEKHSSESTQKAVSQVNYSRSTRDSTIPRSAASGNPEVLVPPDEREGLAQLVATLNEHPDVAVAFLAQHPEKKDALVSVDPLEISDIEIKPLERRAEAETSDGAGEKR